MKNYQFFSHLVVLGLIVIVLLMPMFFVSAEEVDVDLAPDQLEVKSPRLLPTSHLYFLKDWWRGSKQFFTFDKIKKEELRLKQMNERLVEVQELFNQPVDEKTQKAITRAINEYKEQSEKFEQKAGELKEKLDDSGDLQRLKDLVSKNADWELKRQYLLNKLEKEENVNQEVKDLLQSAMAESLGGLATTMSWFEKAIEAKEAIGRSLDKASELRKMYSLQTLKELSEKLSGEAKTGVNQAQAEGLEKLEQGLEKSDQIYKENLLQEFIKLEPSAKVMQEVSRKVEWGKVLPEPIKVEEKSATEALSDTLDLFASPSLVQ